MLFEFVKTGRSAAAVVSRTGACQAVRHGSSWEQRIIYCEAPTPLVAVWRVLGPLLAVPFATQQPVVRLEITRATVIGVLPQVPDPRDEAAVRRMRIVALAFRRAFLDAAPALDSSAIALHIVNGRDSVGMSMDGRWTWIVPERVELYSGLYLIAPGKAPELVRGLQPRDSIVARARRYTQRLRSR
ncbi:MAG: hypothetical protein HYS40_07320 [Gemmatimonadetes bacterium]|nr:hypothetical protein [Gemmatimonadota bacterium]